MTRLQNSADDHRLQKPAPLSIGLVMIRHLTYWLALCLGLFGCASSPRTSPALPPQLVGLWRENSDYYSSVVLRQADGTYIGKREQVLELSKPAVFISERGKWQVSGDFYVTERIETSTSVNANDQRQDKKPIKFEIQSITPERFCYLSPDGALVTERKIGPASLSAFDKATISPLVTGN